MKKLNVSLEYKSRKERYSLSNILSCGQVCLIAKNSSFNVNKCRILGSNSKPYIL